MNSQWNPSLYEVWRQKIVEDIEKQTVRRLQSPGERSLGSVQGPRLLWPLVRCLLQDTGRRVRSLAPSPTRAGRAAWHQEGPACWKSLWGLEMNWETHRGGIHPVGLWTPVKSLPEKLGCQVTPGEGRRVGLCWTLTWIVSRLVRKLGCVKSHVLVKNGGQLLCKELTCSS